MGHVGQDGIRAAERHYGDFGEKHAQPRENVLWAQNHEQEKHRPQPEWQPYRGDAERAAQTGFRMCRDSVTEQVIIGSSMGGSIANAITQPVGRKTGRGGGDDDKRKRQREQKQRGKGQRGYR